MVFCTFFIFACEQKAITSAENKGLKPAHNFTLEKLDESGTVKLDDFKGKPVIINFWASWCAPCREEMPFLQKTWSKYRDKGLIFIGIDVLDDTSAAKEFLDSFNIDYLNLSDSKGKTSNQYGVIALPATFFIDKDGNITRQNYGPFLGDSGEKLFMKYLGEIIN
ncbi:MAG: redoxin domain-containing protein [Candidatus Dadabacteria bacterium]|nr:TlpA family protein disulfide reductase [Candidatus Dadabacteria bacterium]NIY21769.1 redoxin domain-containing protein [Candidatus Dadabacteria bacterium]